MYMEYFTALENYLDVFSITILYYDHLITFFEELQYIWTRPLSMASAWFLVNRYTPILGNVVVLIVQFDSFGNESCRMNMFARQSVLIVSQFVICTISTIRTYALYNRSSKILALILTIGLGGISVVCWSLVDEHGQSIIYDGERCSTAMTHTTAVHLAAAWEAGFAFDLLIFVLIVVKSYQDRVVRGWSRAVQLANVGLMEMLLRDGALYFGIISLANLANVLTFYLASPMLRGSLSTFANCISTTTMSRLMLHVHKVTAAPLLGDAMIDDGHDVDLVFAELDAAKRGARAA